MGITPLVRQAASRRRPACGWCNSKAPRSLLACGVTSASCSRAAARLARWHPAHAPRWVSCSRQCASLIVGVCLMGPTPWFGCVSDRPGGAEVQHRAAHVTTPRLPPVFPWSATQHCARAQAGCSVDLREAHTPGARSLPFAAPRRGAATRPGEPGVTRKRRSAPFARQPPSVLIRSVPLILVAPRRVPRPDCGRGRTDLGAGRAGRAVA